MGWPTFIKNGVFMVTKSVKSTKLDKKVKVKASVKLSAKPPTQKKKPKVDLKKLIPESILETCYQNPEILVVDVDQYSALLIKKKVVDVHEILCAGTMNPIENISEKTFFHSFMLQWGGKITNSDKLEEIGFPVTFIETPQEALYEIGKA